VFGWFIEETVADDEEFSLTLDNGMLIAGSSSLAYNKIDLLTVVQNELGHYLWFEHLAPDTAEYDLMNETLETGMRLLPVIRV